MQVKRQSRYLFSFILLVGLVSMALAGPIASAGANQGPKAPLSPSAVCPTPSPLNSQGGRGLLSGSAPAPAQSSAPGSAQNPSDFPAWEVFSVPGARGRQASVYWPGNGHIYVFGGRNADTQNDYSTYLTSILEGDPGPGTWTTKSAVFPQQNTSNMEAAVLTPTSGIPAIYILGASGPGNALTNTMYIYNPTSDALSTSIGDQWPVTTTQQPFGIVPGGSVVINNKWYVFGGIRPAVTGGYTATWVFDPTAPQGSRWTQIASANLSLGRGFIASAAMDGKIYAIGGGQVNTATTSLSNETIVERLDPSVINPTWQRLADLPVGRSTAKAYAWDTGSGYPNAGHVIVAGGFWYVGSTTAYSYDPVANSWSPFASLVNARRNYGAAQGAGVFYAIGGYQQGGTAYRGDAERYPAINQPPSPTPTYTPVPGGQWQVNTPLNTPRYRVGSAAVGNNIYIIGGFNGNCYDTHQNANESFDVTTGTWTQRTNMPTARGAAATDADGSTIYVAGGVQGPFENNGGTYLNTVEAYNTASNTWSAKANLPATVGGGAGAALNGKFYVIAGDHNVSPYTSNSNYIYDEGANSWTTGPVLPTQTAYGTAATVNGLVYFVGGYNSNYTNVLNSVYAFDPVAGTWMTKSHMLVARQGAEAFALGGELWVIGGGYFRNSNDGGFTPITQTQSVEIYNPGTDSWRYGPYLNFTRIAEGGGVGNGVAMIAAGFDGTSYTSSSETINFVPPTNTPTVTGTPPTNTPTPTITNTPTLSPTPCGYSERVVNGGFETGSFAPWVIGASNNTPVVSTDQAHSGTFSALMGTLSGGEPNGDSSIYQSVSVPASGGTLSFWYWPFTTDTISFDWQDAYIEDTNGNILATIMHVDENTQAWTSKTFDMTPYAGQTVRIAFLVHEDGFGDDTAMYVDDVSLPGSAPCTFTPTVTGTPPTATSTPTNTPTTQPTVTDTPPATNTTTDTPVPPTDTPAPTNTPGGPTDTPIPTSTPGGPTDTPIATNTPGGPTDTPMPTNTPGGPTDTPLPPTVTPTDCPNPFVDITGNVFYTAIHYLNCRGVINGVDATHYGPANTSTRGQFAKVVVLGFGMPLSTPPTQTFSDVPPTYFAYVYIETGHTQGILNGYDQASCQAAGQPYPCYLPNNSIRRGELTKLVVLAGHYPLFTPSSGPDFTDVPANSPFYVFIETAFHSSIIAGYPDHTFRPNNNIRRDEMAQIVYEGIVHMP